MSTKCRNRRAGAHAAPETQMGARRKRERAEEAKRSKRGELRAAAAAATAFDGPHAGSHYCCTTHVPPTTDSCAKRAKQSTQMSFEGSKHRRADTGTPLICSPRHDLAPERIETVWTVVDPRWIVAARAVIGDDVCLMLLAALLQLLLCLLVASMQRWVLYAVHRLDHTGTACCLPMLLQLIQLFAMLAAIEQQQVAVAVRRIDRGPVGRSSFGICKTSQSGQATNQSSRE